MLMFGMCHSCCHPPEKDVCAAGDVGYLNDGDGAFEISARAALSCLLGSLQSSSVFRKVVKVVNYL